MRPHFLAPIPHFGRGKNRLHVGHQQKSPYYWWWAYLRRNADYIACCEQNGEGALAQLYKDFGDVREDNFHAWWTKDGRSVKLFSEKPLVTHLTELESVADWNEYWTAEDVMVVVVPLRVAKRRLKGQFAKLLENRHSGKQGRPAVASQLCTAKYTLARNYTIPNLQTMLSVYDLWLENQSRAKEDKLALWQIGYELKLNAKAAKTATSTLKGGHVESRNILAATVSRYVSQAKCIIANTALGKFPSAN